MGRGEVRFAALPAGTLHVKNGAMCDHQALEIVGRLAAVRR
jgi:hypothetical protein